MQRRLTYVCMYAQRFRWEEVRSGGNSAFGSGVCVGPGSVGVVQFHFSKHGGWTGRARSPRCPPLLGAESPSVGGGTEMS
jgi:hypothetical protein